MTGSSLVTHLLHARLRVPDPEEAAAYYQRSLGLVRVDSDSSKVRLSVAPRDAVVVSSGDILLERGEEAGLAGLAFAVSSVDHLHRVRQALGQAGSNGDGIVRTTDADGCPIEISVPEPPRRRPAVAPSFSFAKLGHVTRRSPNPPEQARWWQETLGFRLSDQIEESFFFLRCNRDHHAVAFVQGPNWDAHHVGLELESWEDLRLVVEHLVASGTRIEFGPGRHGPGKNIFVYFLDPWGIRWELFCELERIDDENHVAGYWKGGRRDTVNLWGPRPPESYFG
jgi:catechol 2,3-dioxygenase-like lactoylglutathione lyase family enzyme